MTAAAYKPNLGHVLELLRAAEAAQPATTAGYEKLLAARCELEQLLTAQKVATGAADVLANVAAAEAMRGDDLARRTRELDHVLVSARLFGQRAAVQIQAAVVVLLKGGDAEQVKARLTDALKAANQVDEIARVGACACPEGTCEFALPRRPLRVNAGVRVKPALSLVQGGEG